MEATGRHVGLGSLGLHVHGDNCRVAGGYLRVEKHVGVETVFRRAAIRT